MFMRLPTLILDIWKTVKIIDPAITVLIISYTYKLQCTLEVNAAKQQVDAAKQEVNAAKQEAKAAKQEAENAKTQSDAKIAELEAIIKELRKNLK